MLKISQVGESRTNPTDPYITHTSDFFHLYHFHVIFFFYLEWYNSSLYPDSVQFNCSVMSASFQPHGLQYTRPPCPSPGHTQTHVHRVGDAIQPSHPLSSPSLPSFNLSQHQGLFKWVSSLHQVAKVLEFQLQHQSFQWTPRTDLL